MTAGKDRHNMGTPVWIGYATRSAILLMSARPVEKMEVRCPRSRQYGIPCSWSDQPWAKPPGTVTEAMIPGFTMRVRVTNRKALLAWFAGQPGETGNHGAAKGRRAVFHMCGGCTGGSIPSCSTRALRFSKLPTAWEPPRHDRATKNRP